MKVLLTPDVQRIIRERVESGRYSTPEDVVSAAVRALDQKEQFGDFDHGELDELLAEAEANIAKEGTLDGKEAYHKRRERRAEQRKAQA